MKPLEIEAKTIDEAIEKACNEFQVSREKLNIEIISEGTAGFLGLVGNKKARIKACLLTLDDAFTTTFKTYPPAPSMANSANGVSKSTTRGKEMGDSAEKAKKILEG